MLTVSELFEVYKEQGQKKYNEEVTQMQHALQVAKLAEENHATDAQIIACLLHDIGHLSFSEDLALLGKDDHHEVHGAKILSQLFGPEFYEPVRLHVEAKRYLCSVDDGYHDALSPASKLSLALQGGRYKTDEQIREFESHPYFKEAVQLRQFDDSGKSTYLLDSDFDYYMHLFKELSV